MADLTGEMKRLADNLGKYIRDKFVLPKLANVVSYFRSEVTAAASGGRITVRKPFDTTVYSLPYFPSAKNLAVGDQCVVGVFGSMSNAWVLGDAVFSNFTGEVDPLRPLGQTPVRLTADTETLTLRGSGSVSYTIQSDTAAVFDVLNGTTNNASVAYESDVFKITAGSGAANWYNSYVQVTVSGLNVGDSYNFIFDCVGCAYNESAHITIGHYILYDANGNTLASRAALDGPGLNTYAFTATTTSAYIRWYPATNSTFLAGTSVATCNRIYIDNGTATDYTAIYSASGSFTDEGSVLNVPAGVTVYSTPSCSVWYQRADQGTLPLDGKTVVCFGDSLFGMYRGDTSAPAYVAEVTGAKVYNVGFGGCRWSDHPTDGYAQFSMWALADAVASGDFSAQEQYASSGSPYFPEQLSILESINFANVDYVVIHYGTNDFGGSVAIGQNSPDTDHSTICGAMRYSIKALLTAYPELRIFISVPVFRFWDVGGVTVYSDTYTNGQNDTLPDVIAAMEDVAEEYNLPIVDGYYKLGINKLNAASFLGDGTHQNANGRKRFGSYIGARLIAER